MPTDSKGLIKVRELPRVIDWEPTRDPVSHRLKRELQTDKPFIAWDGEGITYEDGEQQAYILLAASTGEFTRSSDKRGLSTQDCLDLLFAVEEENRDAIHIGFGFGYDTNQILNSFSRRQLYGLSCQVKSGRTYTWRRWKDDPGYRFKIHPGKFLRISKGTYGRPDYGCITIYDTLGFFQRKFEQVVEGYFPDRLFEIQAGKANRRSFSIEQLDEITKYCLSECVLLVAIMEILRGKFEDVGLYLDQWYGPGAVANASFRRNKIQRYKSIDTPKEVRQASRFAYQGGRFELFKAGYYKNKVYQYDINSAYPAVIATLPQLSSGHWEHTQTFQPGTYGVWNCRYRNRSSQRYDRNTDYKPEPLFFRSRDGRIAYPYNVEGWYWTPEAELLTEITHPCEAEIKEGWIWHPDDDFKPFKYYEERYLQRQHMKEVGDAAEYAIKLELNSGYGKFAQRSGWFREGDRIPNYHQLEWAGYITSATRAKLFRAAANHAGKIIAFETDALFSEEPIPEIGIGPQLGEWSETILNEILYIQSGFYFAVEDEKGVIEHYRGFDKNSISFTGVKEWLREYPINPFATSRRRYYGTTHRFIGFKRALTSRKRNYWRTWETEPREITIGKEGKRIHLPGCPACREGRGWLDSLHNLSVTFDMHPYGASYPHKIPWEELAYTNLWGEEDEIDMTDGRDI